MHECNALYNNMNKPWIHFISLCMSLFVRDTSTSLGLLYVIYYVLYLVILIVQCIDMF